eukprot:178293-Chlamydomonas_euryale.AAC.1
MICIHTRAHIRAAHLRRSEDELDAVSLHNTALLNMDEDPTNGFKKLNFLLSNPPFPPETFANLLLLYCKVGGSNARMWTKKGGRSGRPGQLAALMPGGRWLCKYAQEMGWAGAVEKGPGGRQTLELCDAGQGLCDAGQGLCDAGQRLCDAGQGL